MPGYLERGIPQLSQLAAQIIRLWRACRFFRIRERKCHAVIILVRSRQAKPERSICQLPTNTDFAFGGFTGKDTFKLLVEIAIKPCTRFDARHFPCRIEFVTIHPVDTETLQTSLLVQKQTPSPLWKGFTPATVIYPPRCSFKVPISSPKDLGVSNEVISPPLPCRK